MFNKCGVLVLRRRLSVMPLCASKKMRFDMLWIELKSKVKQLLKDRDLAKPNIRLNSLEKLEQLIKSKFPQIYNNPSSVLQIDKDDFKKNYRYIRN